MALRMKLVVAYLGTRFHGWQRQPGQPTIQGEIEKALARLLGTGRMPVTGAGRTDAGVHAAGQTAHVDLPVEIPPDNLKRGLGRILPPEIRIRSVRPVGPSFHARSSARGKLYVYRLRWRQSSLPWLGLRCAVVPPVTRDWASFTVPDPGPDSTVRTLYRARLVPRGSGMNFEFIGDGFLRYQVRRMVGAVVEVGRHRRSADTFRDLLRRPEPGAPIHTAPATGLCLEKVFYRTTPTMLLERPQGALDRPRPGG